MRIDKGEEGDGGGWGGWSVKQSYLHCVYSVRASSEFDLSLRERERGEWGGEGDKYGNRNTEGQGARTNAKLYF